jgi:uncharacterized protein
MTELDSSTTSHTPAALAPITSAERITTLDVLRGIALLGVVVANVWLWFSGIAFRFPGYREELLRFSLDSVVFFAIGVVVSGKAISTFSFLFGHGFAIQMMRAEARGRSIVRTYSRRLAVLLVIGLVHMLLLWYGDILVPYALLGFVLILFRKRADRTLLVWIVILMVGVPLLMGGIPMVMAAFGSPLPAPDMAEIAKRNAATLAAFQNGLYVDVVRENMAQAAKFYLGRKAVFLLYILGLFILGLYVGRRRMFENVPAHRGLFRRLAMWGIPIGLTTGIVLSWMQVQFEPSEIFAKPWLALVFTLLSVVSMLPLAVGYVSAVTLLLEQPHWARRFAVFAPAGRMALTNYLTQTIVMVLLFNGYGGGMIGRTGPALGLLIALALFGVQMIVSAIWLSHYRFGPAEWVWRSLTYGQAQPMRLPAAGIEHARVALK